jgi:hypothetical protein
VLDDVLEVKVKGDLLLDVRDALVVQEVVGEVLQGRILTTAPVEGNQNCVTVAALAGFVFGLDEEERFFCPDRLVLDQNVQVKDLLVVLSQRHELFG